MVFPEMARIVKNFLITIEDEKNMSLRHFPRNYETIFELCGLKQVESANCYKKAGILSKNFFLRVFQKKHLKKNLN